MDNRKYEILVWSLQAKADNNPDVFRSQVIAISVLAYATVVCLFAVVGVLIWWLLTTTTQSQHIAQRWFLLGTALFALIPLCFIFLRMLFHRISPPTGRVLTKADAPPLFRLLADLKKRFNGPPIHEVLVTPEFNAAISQVPRFGLLGGHRNYLILGLPFLFGMSPREMAAVVAHEYGHLAGSHGKMGAWIYRQRRTFGALYQHADERRERDHLNGIMAAALDRFAPIYNAYTFVLSRQQEYEADAVAARYMGEKHAAAGLIRSRLLGGWIASEFWPTLYAQSASRPAPSFMPYSAMAKIFSATRDDWATDAALQAAWQEESDVHDTHPCLRERVDALDQPCQIPAAVEQSAADLMLGAVALQIAREFDSAWWAEEKKSWLENHQHHVEGNRELQTLEGRPLADMDVMSLQQLALLLFQFRSAAAAKPVLEHLLARPGERYPKPLYYYGWLLLDEGQASGLDKLVEAARLSPAMRDDCARRGYRWLAQHRNEDAAEAWLENIYPDESD